MITVFKISILIEKLIDVLWGPLDLISTGTEA